MKVRLNIQAIRIAERILKKPFSQFDLFDEETFITLLYGAVLSNNEETFTLHTFKKLLEQNKTRKEIVKKFGAEMAFMEQFSEESTGEASDMYMGEMAAFLINSGMDARFVLYEMRLFEIGDYVKAIDNSKRERMESDRFWTYLKIVPHVDGKKLRDPESLIEFPWEKEDKAKDLENEFEKGKEMFYKFINSNPDE